ncbi:MAG: FmdB family zinc ribbon protein [Planctomycetales bacterium]
MPLFEFRCEECQSDFEVLIRSQDQAHCPQCGNGKVKKLFSETAVAVNGSQSSLPLAAACPPGNAPCGPACCRLP